MNSVAAVVVTYNRLELLKECIAALEKQTVPCDVVVVDNASDDGTCEWITEYVKTNGAAHYLRLEMNTGGAGGFNCGMRWAVENGYDFVWVMDDDCIPNEDALQRFLEADKGLRGEYGFLSGKVLWKDGSLCAMNIQRRTVFRNNRNFEGDHVKIAMASFVSLFVPASVIKEVGLPIKEFFVWTDDWEFTRRISRRYPCYLANGSVVTHKSKNNSGAHIASEPPERLGRFDYLYRNDVYLYRREGAAGFFYELIRLIWHSVKVLVKAKDNKLLRLEKIWLGTVAGLRFAPKVEHING